MRANLPFPLRRARGRTLGRSLAAAAPIAILALAGIGCGDNQTVLPERASYDAGPPAALACLPNLDGKIEAKELPVAIGLPARWLVSPSGKDRPVDLVGKVDAQGHRVWDQGSDYADDQQATITATKIDGKWYASSFAGATFVAPFDAGDRVEAVYQADATSIRLMGLASSIENPPEGKTLLVYGAPIALYTFPLAVGTSVTVSGEAKQATLRGQPYAGKDTYEIKVDAAGQLVLPDLTFTQVLRVRTKVTLEPVAGATITQRQTSFFAECFGEVMRATSHDDEPNEDFTTAAEVRRLGLLP